MSEPLQEAGAAANPHLGSSFDSWIDEEGLHDEIDAVAVEAVAAQQIAAATAKLTIGEAHRLVPSRRSQAGSQEANRRTGDMTCDQSSDARLKAYRERMSIAVERLKAELDVWIDQHGGRDVFRTPVLPACEAAPYATEVTSALLETAIDRQINLHGIDDARDMVLRSFERRAKAAAQRLH